MGKRIAVIDREACKPEIANYLCRKVCPVNRSEEDCVTVSGTDKKPVIDESLCIGCGICSNKCPTGAISIINLPAELTEAGFEPLLDDREAPPGKKFKDADLIGIPLRVTVGEKGLRARKLEVKARWAPKGEFVEPKKLTTWLQSAQRSFSERQKKRET